VRAFFLFGRPNKRITRQTNKQTNKVENKKMKATNKNSIDFTSLLPLMHAVHKAEMTLMDALLALWERQVDKSKPMEFRRAFIDFAVANKYDRRWAMEIAVAAGFRARAAGGGRKKSKSKSVSVNKPTRADQIDLSAMPKSELKKLMANIAASL
jgi:hypothetical protein